MRSIIVFLWSVALAVVGSNPSFMFYGVELARNKFELAEDLASRTGGVGLPTKGEWIIDQVEVAKRAMDEAYHALWRHRDLDTIKVVVFPEFAFRPPYSAYTFAEGKRILTALKNYGRQPRFEGFLFVYGTITMYDDVQYEQLRREGEMYKYNDHGLLLEDKWVKQFSSHKVWAKKMMSSMYEFKKYTKRIDSKDPLERVHARNDG